MGHFSITFILSHAESDGVACRPVDPAVLGRGVVVTGGGEPPGPWRDAPRVVVDDDALAAPAAVTATLHDHWLDRRPVVVELAAPAAALRSPEVEEREPWEVGPGFEFTRERLQFLVWANTWDARSAEPVWWWGRKAAQRPSRRAGSYP